MSGYIIGYAELDLFYLLHPPMVQTLLLVCYCGLVYPPHSCTLFLLLFFVVVHLLVITIVYYISLNNNRLIIVEILM